MSIERRGERYLARVYVSGQRRSKTFDAQRDAKRWIAQQTLERGTRTAETCASFAERWPEDYGTRKRESTRSGYGFALRPFVREFDKRRLSDIDRVTARAFALKHRRAAMVARAMYTDALNDGLVSTNPFANLRLEQSRGRRDLEVISEEKLHELADAALNVHGPEYGPHFRALIIFAAYTGLRLGELLALTWDDIDLSKQEVRVKASLSKQGTLTAPKNGKSRTVILPSPAGDALLTFPRHTDQSRVWLSKRFKSINSATSFFAIWNPVRAAAGASGMQFHELRHHCATWFLEQGASHADVAVQLGHTDGGALVMSVYGHPSEDAARERLKGLGRQAPVIAIAPPLAQEGNR